MGNFERGIAVLGLMGAIYGGFQQVAGAQTLASSPVPGVRIHPPSGQMVDGVATPPTCPYRNPQGKVEMVREVRVNGYDAVCEGRKDVGSYRVGVYRLGIHTGVVVHDVKTGASSDIQVPVIGPTIVGLDNGSTVIVGPSCIAGLPLNDCNITSVTNPPSQPPAQSPPKLAPTSRPEGIPKMSPSGNPTAIPTALPQAETRPPALNLPGPLANVPPLVPIFCGTFLLASLGGVVALASFSTKK